MKKKIKTLLIAGLIGLTALSAVGCGASKTEGAAVSGDKTASTKVSDKKVLKYGKAAGPYTILFETGVKPILEKQGYTLKAVDFSDLLQNDTALQQGDIDFNVEQHTAYAENFNKNNKGTLVPISPIPTVPAGIFSGKYKSLDKLTDGAKIAVPNDAANTARAYVLLQKAGWIKLKDGVNLSTATKDDIISNPHKLQFTEMNSINIPTVITDFDYVAITGSVVYNAGIDPSTALLQEDILPHLILQLVVKQENKDSQWAKDIVAAYKSDEFKAYLDKNNKGLWYIPKELFSK